MKYVKETFGNVEFIGSETYDDDQIRYQFKIPDREIYFYVESKTYYLNGPIFGMAESTIDTYFDAFYQYYKDDIALLAENYGITLIETEPERVSGISFMPSLKGLSDSIYISSITDIEKTAEFIVALNSLYDFPQNTKIGDKYIDISTYNGLEYITKINYNAKDLNYNIVALIIKRAYKKI